MESSRHSRQRRAARDLFQRSLEIPAQPSLGGGNDPAELAIGQLHETMAGSKLSENLAVDHEGMRPRHIDEYGCQILIPRSLRRAVNCYRHGPSIWLPALEGVEAGEGQQRSTPVLRLECHHRHLRLLVRCESGDRLPQTSGGGHDWDEQSVTTDRGNGSQVREWGGFGGRGCNQTPGLSRRCTCVTEEWGGC
jgi:hypothetical protein